jgi:hypothetical protein
VATTEAGLMIGDGEIENRFASMLGSLPRAL